MKVVLAKDVTHLGKKYDVKGVKRGFYLNYLFPRGLALSATPGRIKHNEEIRALKNRKQLKISEWANGIKEALKDAVLVFEKKVSAKNSLYGSISEKDIVQAIKKIKKVELKKEHIKMKSHIKKLGEYQIPIHLTDGVGIEIKVEVKEGSGE